MREAAAIIAPSIDINQIARSIMKAHVALQDCERKLADAETKTQSLRDEAARRRLEIGRLLIEAKPQVSHGNWESFIGKLGISSQRSSEWTREASQILYRDSQSPESQDSGDCNPHSTAAQRAGTDKKPRKQKREEQPDADPESPGARTSGPTTAPTPTVDIDRELSRIQDKVLASAKTLPERARKQLAHELRETARLIEEM